MKGWILVFLVGLIAGCSNDVEVVGQSIAATQDTVSADVAVEQGVDLFEHSTGAVGGDNSCVFNGCDDGDSCTHDYCSFRAVSGTWECEADFAEIVCDDGNPCTTGDVCKMGTCVAGQPTNCMDDDACTVDECGFATAGCIHKIKNCSDMSVWTYDECSDGACSNHELQLIVSTSIEKFPAESKPPVSYSPTIFVGNENKVVYNETDKWMPLSGFVPYSLWLKGYCTTSLSDQPHWDAGYVKIVNGWGGSHVMLGGHTLTMKIGVHGGQWGEKMVGFDQPVLLPLSGTQEYVDGIPVPQHYISPNLKAICEKMKKEG